MSRKELVFKLFKENKKILKGIGIRSIGIFGSIARSEDTKKSDFDILVEFTEKNRNFNNFSRLCDFLENHIGENYDLIMVDGLSPHFGEKILKEVQYANIDT